MADQRNGGIAWTDMTWNPIAMRCTRVSAGCENCWHLPMAHRMANNQAVSDAKRVAYAGGAPYLDERKLLEPLQWKRQRKIAVQLMGDLFHELVPFEWIDRVFAVMALCQHHTFQLLTKRPDRMPQWYQVATAMLDEGASAFPRGSWDRGHDGMPDPRQPLPNVWLGTTVENQVIADRRIPHLLATPAAVRFLSCEPLLGCIDLSPMLEHRADAHGDTGVDWVIAGGESGPNARPCHPEWARSLRDQCAASGVPFLFKQWGEWVPVQSSTMSDTRLSRIPFHRFPDGKISYRVGKKLAGRLLDGVVHSGMPE